MSELPPEIAELPQRLLPVDDPAAHRDRPRHAAVLVLFYPGTHTVHFPLTVRCDRLTRHPGQIALPGGAVEQGDRTGWDAALRETREELGIALERVEPLGRLATHHLTVSDYLITPFVAWTAEPPTLRPDPAEVAEVFAVTLADLVDPALVERETWTRRDRLWSVTFYRFDGRVVWGATARILYELACRLQERPVDDLGPGSVVPQD